MIEINNLQIEFTVGFNIRFDFVNLNLIETERYWQLQWDSLGTTIPCLKLYSSSDIGNDLRTKN